MKRIMTKRNVVSAAIGIIGGCLLSGYAVNHRSNSTYYVKTEPLTGVEVDASKLEPVYPKETEAEPIEIESETESHVLVQEKPQFKSYDFIPLDEEIQVQINGMCEQHNISFDVVMALIKTETEFEWIVGDEGCSVGYMQIQPEWWSAYAEENHLNIYEPLDNIHLGIMILVDAVEQNDGDLNRALKQYNSGNPDFPGTEYLERFYDCFRWIHKQKEGV